MWLGVVISRRVARSDSYPALPTIMIASVVLHLLCAPAQIFVVEHFYNGVADWTKYVHQGALLADNWRSGQYTTAGTGISGLLGDGTVSVFGAVIMTVVGPDKLAAFFVCSWLAFIGTVFFYRAFAVTFPEADRRRYAVLVFLFPSLLFWTASVSKEDVMLFALGLTAYGIALILSRGGLRGYLYAVLGGALALVVRPDELVILVIGFAAAMLVRGVAPADRARTRHLLRTAAALVFVVAGVVVTGIYASHFVHSLTGSGLSTKTLSTVGAHNQGSGAGFGSSNVAYSANPLLYPRDIYTVLLDPLPFSAHSITQLFAAAENTLLLGVIIFSLPRLRYLLRASVQRPYVLAAFFYSAAFMYAFAALGNLGLITRERTLLLPFLFVVLAVPVAAKGAKPYPWQARRQDQRRRDVLPAAVRPEEDFVDGDVDWDSTQSARWGSEPSEVDGEDWVPSEWVTEP